VPEDLSGRGPENKEIADWNPRSIEVNNFGTYSLRKVYTVQSRRKSTERHID
jgi:hypothetical protein